MTAVHRPDEELRVAFVGLGGAGQRHARVLRSLLGWDAEWVAVRSRGTTPVLDAAFQPQPGSMSDAYHLSIVASLAAALETSPDLVVIATPTALHRDAAIMAIEARCPVLVEKPLAATSSDAGAVVQAAEARGVPAFVGFQRRHHPAWTLTQRQVAAGVLGTLRSVSMWCASDVTTWHPYEPLEGLYAVRADLGGGVIATECHEIDQLVGLLGVPATVSCEATWPSDDGQVERSAEVILGYDDDPGCVARVTLSFDEPRPRRGWTFEGAEATIHWEETVGELVLTRPGGGREVTHVEGTGNDDLVAVQDRWVLDRRLDLPAAASGLEQARAVSAVIEAARRSSRSGQPQPL